MFEQEAELEKHQSGIVPLLLVVGLLLAGLGSLGYYLWQNKQTVLNRERATAVINASLRTQGPASIQFYTGQVTASVNVHPRDPNYVLLEKAGWLKLEKDKGNVTPVVLTAKGEQMLQQIPGVQKTEEKDKTTLYRVPIAERQLVEVSRINLIAPIRANVEYSWKWAPNQLGEVFDASGPLVQSFTSWQRASLIQKYGADFYHGAPTKVVIALTKSDNTWQVATEY